jgi:hypothetical protein
MSRKHRFGTCYSKGIHSSGHPDDQPLWISPEGLIALNPSLFRRPVKCSYLTAGTALVGAGAIALSPINPAATTVHDLHVPAVMSGLRVELAAAPNPLQTWTNTALNAYSNVNTLMQAMILMPAPLSRQVVANLINYVAIDVGGFQAAAAGAVSYYGGTGSGSFEATMQQAVTQLEAGNISGAVSNLGTALVNNVFFNVLQPLEAALAIPNDVTANIAAATNYIMDGFVPTLGIAALSVLVGIPSAIGADLQAAYTSATTGDLLGTIASLVDLPGAITNATLNGTGTGGLLGSIGLAFLKTLPQSIASAVVSPGAQNIVAHGSVVTALEDLVTQLTTGWPTPSDLATIPVGIAAGLNGLPQAIVGVIARAVHGLVGGASATAAAAHTATAITPAAAASPPTSAARTVSLSVATSRTALAASTAGSDTTTTGPSTPDATVAGAPQSPAHTATAAPSSGAGAQVSTATTSSAAQDHQSVGRHRPSGNTAHPASSARSGSGK